MNFQTLPIPLPRLKDVHPQDTLPPSHAGQCGCRCNDSCACACVCGCRDHCTCLNPCTGKCGRASARNLIVSLDGAFKTRQKENSTVLELHTQILVDPSDNQIAYYDPGSRHAPFNSLLGIATDILLGGRVKKSITNAYRWLCEQYQPGDKIFLFGFSHGAYNVQTLASMIDTVGLVNVGNQRFFSMAYDVFYRAQDGQDVRAAAKFRSTFSRKVKVHFVGVWDTSVPVNVFGARPGPSSILTQRVCIYRQALALDEVGLKCVPAVTEPSSTMDRSTKSDSASVETKIGSEFRASVSSTRTPRRRTSSLASTFASGVGPTTKDVKEVWFPGTHAEMGAGLKPDIASNLSLVPLSWMENEAANAGLRLRSRLRSVKSKWDALHEGKHPLSSLRRMLEFRPNKRRLPRTQRRICPGQLVHASIAFQSEEYRPRAAFSDAASAIEWNQLVGQNPQNPSFEWALTFGDRLDMNFFDGDTIVEAIRNLNDVWKGTERYLDGDRESFWVERLSFMALSGKLCATYLAAKGTPVWDDDREIELASAVKFFQRLAKKQPAIFTGDLAEILEAQCRLHHSVGAGKGHVDVEKQFEEALRLRRVDVSLPINQPLRVYKLAVSLVCNGAYAVVISQKPQKALFFFDEGVEVLRPLLEQNFSLSFPYFALLQRNLGACLQSLSHDSSALRLCQTVVALSRDLMESHPQCNDVLAAALHDLAFGFPRTQSTQEPSAAAECIILYRSLAEEDPGGYDALLADALHNYSLHLLLRGQHEKAHCTSLEELQLRRKLRDLESLASCLEQLARCLIVIGKATAAFESADEAVRIRQRNLEEVGTGHEELKLADALHLLSCCLAQATGRADAALNAARQAVSTQRGLAKDTMFNLRLAVFLTNFSIALSETGNDAEALRAAQEVVKIRAEGWGDDGNCALSLGRMAICLRNVGKQDDALVVAEKCLDLVQSIVVNAHSDEWEVQRTEAQLAATLYTLSFCFADSPNCSEVALQVAAESATRYRKLVAKSSSAAADPAFVFALLQWSLLLVLNDQQDAALRIAVEAAQTGGGLISKDVYAQSLYHLSTCLYAVGKEQQASAPAQRSVEILRALVAEHQDSWRLKEQLADAVFNASLYPSHPPSLKALEAVREGVELQRQLKDHVPRTKYDQRLADGMQNLAARALLAGLYDEAFSASEEAVELGRTLVQRNSSLYTPNLINILYTHANVLCEQGRYEDAYDLVEECDAIGQDIQNDSVFTTLEASAAYMSTRARCLLGLEKRVEGNRGLMEGMRLYRCALESPLRRSMFESFPWFLNNTFACISTLGRTNADALNATSELVELARLLTENCASQVALDHYLRLVIEYHVGSLSGQ
ncbi:hypothetical protein C8F01DRAFT_782916 [Mycena amicta]|nr:hypothetical protein C8F01DRAFT_782916 [Mycena amicta]